MWEGVFLCRSAHIDFSWGLVFMLPVEVHGQ